MVKASEQNSRQIALNLVDPPRGQIRMEISQEGIRGLADSIKAIGQLQPILVRPLGSRYEVVFGHRRYLAFVSLGRKNIQAVVRELTDQQAALMRATENVERVDVSPIEEAAVYQDLVETHSLTVDQIGTKMGKSPGVVKRRLDLLKMLPQLQKAIHEKKISYGVGEEFDRIKDPATVDYYLGYAIDHGCTVAVARQWVSDYQKEQRTKHDDVAGGGGVTTPLESRPVYVSCDLCSGPLEVMQIVHIKACPSCVEAIKKAMASKAN